MLPAIVMVSSAGGKVTPEWAKTIMKEEARLTLASVQNTSKDLKAGVPGLEDSHSDSTGVLYVVKSHLKETESLGDQLWGKLNANLKNSEYFCILQEING